MAYRHLLSSSVSTEKRGTKASSFETEFKHNKNTRREAKQLVQYAMLLTQGKFQWPGDTLKHAAFLYAHPAAHLLTHLSLERSFML